MAGLTAWQKRRGMNEPKKAEPVKKAPAKKAKK